MFAPYQNILQRLKAFEQKVDEIVIEAVKEYEAEIIDMNLEQLDSGINGEGENITPAYSTMTVRIKREKGQPTGRVTLKDEGDFYDAFMINYGSDHFSLLSRDDKTEKLERKYGRDIFGLTNVNIENLKELIREDLVEAIKKIIR